MSDKEISEEALASELFDVMIKILSSESDRIGETKDILEDFIIGYREQMQKISPLINKGYVSQIEEFTDHYKILIESAAQGIQNLDLIGERMDIFTKCATDGLLQTLSNTPQDMINTEDLQENLQWLTVEWAGMFNLNLDEEVDSAKYQDEINKAAAKIMKMSSEKIRKEKEKIGHSEVVAEMEKYADLLERKGENAL